jgi:hypothetical protein
MGGDILVSMAVGRRRGASAREDVAQLRRYAETRQADDPPLWIST